MQCLKLTFRWTDQKLKPFPVTGHLLTSPDVICRIIGPKDVHVLLPKPVNMLPCMAKRIFKIKDLEIILNYLGGTNLITWVF